MILIIFKKKFWGGKCTILGPEMVHRHNSGSAARISLHFAQGKGPIGR